MRGLSTLADMNEYLGGISHRLEDHGERWRPVVQTLVLEFLAKLSPNVPLEVREWRGATGNQIRFTLENGRRLRVTYHGKFKVISIRDAETQQTLHTYRPDSAPETVGHDCRRLAQRRRRLAA
jgi:YD repeat-containing protein